MMKLKLSAILLLIGILFFVITPKSNAQMMGGSYTQISQDQINLEQKEQDEGLQIFQELQNKQITCQDLTDDNFNKLGDYFMWKALGSTESHAAMDQRITQMMGDNGNTQMHIILGKRGSGCFSNISIPSNTPSFMMGMMNNAYANEGGGKNMMGNWGWAGSMMGWAGFGSFNLFSFLFCIVAFIDLVLLGVYLWKQINKKK
jgi:hypothetical protein